MVDIAREGGFFMEPPIHPPTCSLNDGNWIPCEREKKSSHM